MVALGLLALPTPWFVRTDIALFWQHWGALYARVGARLVLVAGVVAGLIALRNATARSSYSRIVFLSAMVVTLSSLAVYLIRPEVLASPWRTRPIAIAVMYFAMPNSFWRQVTPPLLLSIGLALLQLLRPDALGAEFTGDFIVLCVINLAGIVVVKRRLELEADVDEAWARQREARAAAEQALEELQTLRGIIPICSHCKNVRTELGDWQVIEEYVRDHSSADFSHGICPSCVKKLYPKEAGA